MKELEYPTINPTEIENELNYLQKHAVQVYRQVRNGEMSQEDYELFKEAMDSQVEIINQMEQ